jgi:hypothetical protein
MVGHSVLTLLHEFQLTDIRLEQSGKVGIWTFRAFDVEPPLCILQFAHKAVIVGELFAVAPHKEHGTDDGARLAVHDRQTNL